MKFIMVPGLKGKVFQPEVEKGTKKKHGCPDCYFCQNCSDDRCFICLGKSSMEGKGLCGSKAQNGVACERNVFVNCKK